MFIQINWLICPRMHSLVSLASRIIRSGYKNKNKNITFLLPDPRKVQWVKQGSYEIISKESPKKILGTAPLNPCSGVCMSARDHLGLFHVDRMTETTRLKKYYDEFIERTKLRQTRQRESKGTNFVNVYYFTRVDDKMIRSEELLDNSPRDIECATRNLFEHLSANDGIKLNFFNKSQRVIKIERSMVEDAYKDLDVDASKKQMIQDAIPRLKDMMLKMYGNEIMDYVDRLSQKPEFFLTVIIDMANRSTFVDIEKPNRFFLSSRELQFLKHGLMPSEFEIFTNFHRRHVNVTGSFLLDHWNSHRKCFDLMLGTYDKH